MDKASKKFENYIDFWLKFRPTVADKILFYIYKGIESPQELRLKMKIAKGNLANYCKRLIKDGKLVQHTQGRVVKYELTAKGSEYIKKFLENVIPSECEAIPTRTKTLSEETK